jgi:hypothetical protein
MLDFNETEKKDAIERHICLKIKDSVKNPLDIETSKILIQLLFIKKDEFTIPQDKKPFLYQVIEKRITLFDYKIVDERLLLFLANISKNPAVAVMYIWYLQWWCFNNDVNELTLDIFCQKIFPWGSPTVNKNLIIFN